MQAVQIVAQKLYRQLTFQLSNRCARVNARRINYLTVYNYLKFSDYCQRAGSNLRWQPVELFYKLQKSVHWAESITPVIPNG